MEKTGRKTASVHCCRRIEIKKKKKILQFYANELDRNDCKPSEEIQTAFNKWLDNIPKTKWKPRKIKEAA